MPDASATKPAFGLTAKIFLASTLLVVAVLGITFGVTSVKAHRTADASIHRALLSTRRAVDDYLAARTRTLGRASTVATDVPQYRQRLLNQRARAEALDQADDIRGLIDAAWVLVTNSDGILIARTDYREQYDRDLSVARGWTTCAGRCSWPSARPCAIARRPRRSAPSLRLTRSTIRSRPPSSNPRTRMSCSSRSTRSTTPSWSGVPCRRRTSRRRCRAR